MNAVKSLTRLACCMLWVTISTVYSPRIFGDSLQALGIKAQIMLR